MGVARLALVVFGVAFLGCDGVDITDSRFICNEKDKCPKEFTCCPDGYCRKDCGGDADTDSDADLDLCSDSTTEMGVCTNIVSFNSRGACGHLVPEWI